MSKQSGNQPEKIDLIKLFEEESSVADLGPEPTPPAVDRKDEDDLEAQLSDELGDELQDFADDVADALVSAIQSVLGSESSDVGATELQGDADADKNDQEGFDAPGEEKVESEDDPAGPELDQDDQEGEQPPHREDEEEELGHPEPDGDEGDADAVNDLKSRLADAEVQIAELKAKLAKDEASDDEYQDDTKDGQELTEDDDAEHKDAEELDEEDLLDPAEGPDYPYETRSNPDQLVTENPEGTTGMGDHDDDADDSQMFVQVQEDAADGDPEYTEEEEPSELEGAGY